MSTPEYDKKSRFPKKQPKGICRGCRGPITEKGRLTWCSRPCKEKFDPFYVKQKVWARDGGKCVMCKCDLYRHGYYSPHNPGETYSDWQKRLSNRKKQSPEYDHIIPHSEGGLFVLENIRLLCHVCHVAVTTEWRRAKSKLRKSQTKSSPSEPGSLSGSSPSSLPSA